MLYDVSFDDMRRLALSDLDDSIASHRFADAPTSCYQAARQCLAEYDRDHEELLPGLHVVADPTFTYRFARQLYMTAAMLIAHYEYGEEWDTRQVSDLLNLYGTPPTPSAIGSAPPSRARAAHHNSSKPIPKARRL